jgi:hypothetical protein
MGLLIQLSMDQIIDTVSSAGNTPGVQAAVNPRLKPWPGQTVDATGLA